MNHMNIQQGVSLAGHSTMGLGGPAAYLAEATTRMEVLEALSWAQSQKLPVHMIGEGSNIIWSDAGFNGLVIVNKIRRFEVFDEDEENTYFMLGSGEPWDEVVARSAEAGLTGIECLSLIPGTAGATPMQNVGAYGQEISQTLTTVEAFDTQMRDFVTLAGADCAFGYRTSRFKTTDRGRFFITGLTLHLSKGNPSPPFYGALQTYLAEHQITQYTPASIRQAVIDIRSNKLPDPKLVRNCGSFFANPVITLSQYTHLETQHEGIPHWQTQSGIKLSAAWLIEQAGFKDFHDAETGMSTWARQPLVLVNEKAQSVADLLKFKDKIVDAVQAKFNIVLQQEPESF